MHVELTEKQKEALERFQRLKIGALFMRQGTGKTRVALELVNYNQPDYLLYLTPYSTIENAQAEIERWGCCCPYDVVGYETIASSDKKFVELYNKLDPGKRNFIIADESIFIKNGRSKRTNRSKRLRARCQYALILNGTPVTRDEWDLFNQMDFLSEKILQMDYRQFLQMFFVEHEHDGQKYHTFYEPNRPALVKLCSPYVYEADLEFAKNEQEFIHWIPCSQEGYRKAKEKILGEYASYTIDCLLNLFAELQHVSACIPEKNSAVADYARGRRCIVFCTYRDEIRQIGEQCDSYVITGDTSLKERKKILEQFKDDEKPLLLMLGCGSYGLNLQFCNEIVYSSISFDYAQMEQSEYRIKRLGQQSDIQYTYILADVGINQMMLKNLDKKENLLDIVKNLIREADKGA